MTASLSSTKLRWVFLVVAAVTICSTPYTQGRNTKGQSSPRYVFQGSHEDWDDAEAACATRGGCLATFHSQQAFQAAQDAVPRGHRNDFLWIGLRRNDTGFFWVTGEAINITFLESITGQTEGTLKADPRLCFVLSRGKPLGRSNCHDANRYLCEHPASAKTTSAKVRESSEAVTQYRAYNEKRKRDVARTQCESHGGRLATIRNSADKTQAERAMSDKKQKYWAGLWYDPTKKTYRWADGTATDKDDQNLMDIIEEVDDDEKERRCFNMKRGKKLEEDDCDHSHYFLCDFPSSPSVTTASTKVATTRVVTASTKSAMPIAPTPTTVTSVTVTASATASSEPGKPTTKRPTTTKPTKKTTPGRGKPDKPDKPGPPTNKPLKGKVLVDEYVEQMRSLEVASEQSLEKAVNITSMLLAVMKEVDPQSSDERGVNVLAAVREFEEFGTDYGKQHKNFTSATYRTGNLVVRLQRVQTNVDQDLTFPGHNERNHRDDTSITLPARLFGKGGNRTVLSILYQDMAEIVPDGSTDVIDGVDSKNKLFTRIIASSVDPPLGEFEENVTIRFTPVKGEKLDGTSRCVFWDFAIKSEFNGSWSTKGCAMNSSTDNETVCICNHLTNFAVLMQVGEHKFSQADSGHKMALQIITYIGLALSLIGEVATTLVYVFLLDLKNEQVQIRLNLVAALAIAQIVFLSGIEATEHQGTCIFVAVCIHFFYLSGFGWMLMEGFYLYLMVVKVFNTEIKMALYYAFAWGFPAVMVVLSIAIAASMEGGVANYIQSEYCWVSFSNSLVWTFVAPVLFVCLVNCIILGRTVHEMIRMQKTNKPVLDSMKTGVKAFLILFPILGITWIFGILCVTKANLAFQYIFTILNSMQGLFIFVLHVVRNSDVRTAFQRKREKWILMHSTSFASSRTTAESIAFTDRVTNGSRGNLGHTGKTNQVLPAN